MAHFSKPTINLSDGVTLTAGAGDTTSSSADLTDPVAVASEIAVKLTNGATGPTTAAQVQIQISPDDTEWYDYGGTLVGSITNSAEVSWVVELPASTAYVRTVAGSNTAQDVTLEVHVTALAEV